MDYQSKFQSSANWSEINQNQELQEIGASIHLSHLYGSQPPGRNTQKLSQAFKYQIYKKKKKCSTLKKIFKSSNALQSTTRDDLREASQAWNGSSRPLPLQAGSKAVFFLSGFGQKATIRQTAKRQQGGWGTVIYEINLKLFVYRTVLSLQKKIKSHLMHLLRTKN